MTLQEIMQTIAMLSTEERRQLIKWLMDTLAEANATQPQHSLLELVGLGAELWHGIDAQMYISELRREWDDRL
ncbi:MAG: hypothetical protein DYG88_10560 [Chloroflexi bacterium CFX4]|nr:hypothetical protein [Chloroflexi bacterium CFX4]MDL1923321.1 hypothetical protein [Chloroflexi bacterium CFX3]